MTRPRASTLTFYALRFTALTLLLIMLPAVAHAQDVLTLEEAIGQALEQNYAVRTARNAAEIAANDATLGNAGFLPTVSLNAGYNGSLSNTRQEFVNGDPQERTQALTTRQNLGATMQWTALDGWLGRVATYDRLQALRSAQFAQTESTVELLVADVIIAYFDLVRQQQQLEVLREAVEISEERVRIAELRLDLGSASELEVRQARVDLNTDRAAMLRQETTLAQAKADFNQLLVRPVEAAFTVEPELVVDATLALDALQATALQHNPALQQAEFARTAVALERRAIAAERFPRLDLSLGYGYSNVDAGSGFLVASRSLDFTYGASLTHDLFDGFDRRRRAQNAQIREESAALAIADVRTSLEADLNALYAGYLNSLQLIALEEENLEATSLNVEVALERFRLGTITSVELREVQEQLIQAESRLLLAQFEAKRAETELRRLSGTLVGE